MRKFFTTAAAMAALGSAAFLAAPAQAAEVSTGVSAPIAALQKGDLDTSYAQYRGRRNVGPRWRGGPRRAYGRPYYGRPGYYRRDYGGAAAAGAIGLATGAIIGGALAQSQAQAAQPTYVVPNQNNVAYCSQRFKSYDPASGTYLGYDGLRHPCP